MTASPEKNEVVAFQGNRGAYSEAAATRYYGHPVRLLPCHSFDDVFEKVTHGEVTSGIVPIENSLTGSIHEIYDLLLKRNLVICGEIKLRIVHCLITVHKTTLSSIRRIYAHPQAIFQCRKFIDNLKDVEVETVYDTAAAARIVMEHGLKNEAAIASAQAAADYRLTILKRGIESNHLNYTRFIIIAKKLFKRTGRNKTSVVYEAKNIPGALFRSLSVFALRDINLHKIESRPIPGQPWKYLFYLDFEGDIRDKKTMRAIEHLSEISVSLKLLGSYRPGDEVTGKILRRQNE